MDGTEERQPMETVGILVFSRDQSGRLYSIALQSSNTQTWTYYGGDRLEGEAPILAAQRCLRESVGVDVDIADLVPVARTTDLTCRCSFFAVALSGFRGGIQFSLSQVPHLVSEMAMDVPVLIEMAKLALLFPDDIYFTAEMK